MAMTETQVLLSRRNLSDLAGNLSLQPHERGTNTLLLCYSTVERYTNIIYVSFLNYSRLQFIVYNNSRPIFHHSKQKVKRWKKSILSFCWKYPLYSSRLFFLWRLSELTKLTSNQGRWSEILLFLTFSSATYLLNGCQFET